MCDHAGMTALCVVDRHGLLYSVHGGIGGYVCVIMQEWQETALCVVDRHGLLYSVHGGIGGYVCVIMQEWQVTALCVWLTAAAGRDPTRYVENAADWWQSGKDMNRSHGSGPSIYHQ